MERWTLRYAVVGLLFLALVGLEGGLMRMQLIDIDALSGMESLLNAVRVSEGEISAAETFYAMLTAHPIVGVYGFAYMCIMGAFYFLVPYLLKTEIRHKRLVVVNFWLQIIGVMVSWGAGFFLLFNALYTLYWPLPVAYDQVPLLGSVLFGLGLVIIEVNVLLFGYNLIRTVLQRGLGRARSFAAYLGAAFGISQLIRRLKGEEPLSEDEEAPVFIVAVARGSIDTAINAVVMLSAGMLLLVYGLPLLVAGLKLNPASVDALLYKNWFWWGLDMIADGNVLMYTAGTWYLLVPLLVNRRLYGEAVVRWVILGDLSVSLFVWSHHLLADQPQPLALKLISGQFITWGEFFTMGLTMFAVLMTIWKARPVKFSPGLKFVLGSIFGFIVGGMAGLTQANLGLNVVLHNTQWVIGIHAHTMLLVGLSMLLFAVVYVLVPMLTGLEIRSKWLVNLHFWGWILGAMIMTYAMGMAGSAGMLRRTLYTNGLYQPYMIVAMFGAILMTAAFIMFLTNLLITLGWSNILALVKPGRRLEAELKSA
jgi:cytochrome c oxidase subunit 1